MPGAPGPLAAWLLALLPLPVAALVFANVTAPNATDANAPGVLAKSAPNATDVAALLRPRYALVDDKIETLWQRPKGNQKVKGLVFIAHHCHHQATDFFTETGSDGWKLSECKSSNFGGCLGLPEERVFVRKVRARGYIPVAVSGGARHHNKCWHDYEDGPKVERALRHVMQAEGLPDNTEIMAVGCAAGGFFLAELARGTLAGNIRCLAPMGSDAHLLGVRIPTIFVYMPKDDMLMKDLDFRLKVLRQEQLVVGEVRLGPRPVNKELFMEAFPEAEAERLATQLQQAGWVDDNYYLEENPATSHIVEWLETNTPSAYSLERYQSPILELINTAWAEGGFTGEPVDEILDFCERNRNATDPTLQLKGEDRTGWLGPIPP